MVATDALSSKDTRHKVYWSGNDKGKACLGAFVAEEGIRAATIHSPHDTICIAILASQYDTCRDTLFRLEIFSNCMWIILWCSTKVLTIF